MSRSIHIHIHTKDACQEDEAGSVLAPINAKLAAVKKQASVIQMIAGNTPNDLKAALAKLDAIQRCVAEARSAIEMVM